MLTEGATASRSVFMRTGVTPLWSERPWTRAWTSLGLDFLHQAVWHGLGKGPDSAQHKRVGRRVLFHHRYLLMPLGP